MEIDFKLALIMIVLSYKTIKDFVVNHPAADAPLINWYSVTQAVQWANHNQLKATFPSADFVGNERYVFNVGGNNYRLIASVNFRIRTVYIKFIGTHVEYDKVDAATVVRQR